MDGSGLRRGALPGHLYNERTFDEQGAVTDDDDDKMSMSRPFLGPTAPANRGAAPYGLATLISSSGMEAPSPEHDSGSPASLASNIGTTLASKWHLFRSTISGTIPSDTPKSDMATHYASDQSSSSLFGQAGGLVSFRSPSSLFSSTLSWLWRSSMTVLSVGQWLLLQVLGIAVGVILTGLIISAISGLLMGGDGEFGHVTPKERQEPKNTKAPPPPPPPSRPPVMLERVYFKDILGIDEAKEELTEVVKFIKHPKLYQDIGAKIPKGVLLVGPPGTGKTMLAKAVATEANIPFIYTSGPEFVEIFVGQGAQRVRNLFAKARKQAPCIVFVDEIDAIGAKRTSGAMSGQNREHDQTLNQLLVEMDGFNISTGITVLAATNRLEALDRALLRPGRFDRVVHIPLPSLDGREAILRRYLSDVKYDKEGVDIRALAKLTPGYSGADLKNLVNEAALICVRNGRTLVGTEDLQEARDKVGMGAKRRTSQPELQRRMTAYHEAGHALVAYHLYPNTDPIHKATIIHRGSALGFVEQLPEGERHSYKLAQMKARLAVCMGGRIAEELVFGRQNVTSGASSDITAASELAYRMVTEWGMSPRLGPVNLRRIGGIQTPHGTRKLSHDTAQVVEKEVERLVEEAHHVASSIIRRHRDQLERIAERLLEEETLTGEQIDKLIRGSGTSAAA
ncbi:cell division protein metalloprotease FtsH, putative [Babesia bigemina]|uniref:Cell division protein metalloprotease FtsH, putative n=1 Tax=Babesia bigemina TaxID=5866 RepID=A0A061D729_BABBI|nr:cell division protein metalloprotease FtsH, putative [Babesia bigemina]CDR94729.1 cell division protein metalloprotease FtsH, putative [Babesia bigemina]|eukprot:XP_012766915.1 cell division protein metalloprotease FtsH, putative [Babesia bigemina]